MQCDKCQKCLDVSLWKETTENRIVIISVPNVQGWYAPTPLNLAAFFIVSMGFLCAAMPKQLQFIGQATGKQLPRKKSS